jgi:hypothetical protein
LLTLSLKLGVTCVERNGYETFKGIKQKGEYEEPNFRI